MLLESQGGGVGRRPLKSLTDSVVTVPVVFETEDLIFTESFPSFYVKHWGTQNHRKIKKHERKIICYT